MRKVAPVLMLTALLQTAGIAGAQTSPVPLSLSQAIAGALSNNPSYRMALAATDASSARLMEARAAITPSFGLSYGYQYANPVAELATPFGPLPFQPNSTQLPLATATYALYNPVAVAQIGAASAGLAQVRANEHDARAATIAAVSRAYYDVLVANQSEAVAREALQAALQHEDDARKRLAAGVAPRADLLDAKATSAQRRVELIQAQNGVSLAQNALDAVLNVPMTTQHALTDTFPTVAPAATIDSLVASAKATRGDIVAAQQALVAAGYAVQAARDGRLPTVTTSISEGNTQPVVQQAYKSQFIFSLQAVWRLFDGGLSNGRESEARANIEQARLELEKTGNDVELNVRQAYATMLAAQEQVRAARDFADAASESERLAQIRYRGGVGTALELRDSELRVINAQQSYVAAQASFARSITDLRFAAGLL